MATKAESDLRKFAGFGKIRGRTLRTGYLLIRSNIWIQGKDTLQIDLKQRQDRSIPLLLHNCLWNHGSKWSRYLFSFGVSTLDPLNSHALIVCVQRRDHRLVYPSYRGGKDRKVMRGLGAAHRNGCVALSHGTESSNKPKDKQQRQI